MNTRNKKPTRETAIVTRREIYTVDGGAVVDESTGRIDLSRDTTHFKTPDVSLYVTRGELEFYPIGARVRVTVERLGKEPK